LLGKGGMCEVYQARDLIDHQNIGVVHEINQTKDGQAFIVITCYEGPVDRVERKRHCQNCA